MKFISESPEQRYRTFSYQGLNIYLDHNDVGEEPVQNAKGFCINHGYGVQVNRATAIYFLRGHRWQVDYCQVLVGVLETAELPVELNEIIHCLSFWNQDGRDCYNMNKEGDESYADFILKCIAADCRAFVNSCNGQFITGKGGSHVWVGIPNSEERILLIHFPSCTI